MEPYPPDDGVEEIRAIRRKIFAECGNDLNRLAARYIALQEQHRDRLIPPPEQPVPADEPAA